MLGFQVHPTIELPGTLKKYIKMREGETRESNQNRMKSKLHLPFLVYHMTEIGTFVHN